MKSGIVEGIYIAATRGAPTEYVEQVHVIPGHGIVGDRFFYQPGISEPPTKPGRELTLIEIEAIEAACLEAGIHLTPDQTRRNIVTRGVSLNNLISRTFFIGGVALRGVRLCEPCNHLAGRTHPRVLQSLAHRGGLRVEIISDGIIHIKDIITIPD